MFFALVLILLIFNQISLIKCGSDYTDYEINDIYIPENCEQIAKQGDHLLLEYEITFSDGSFGASLKQPDQLYHILLDISDESPVTSALKGMCSNSTRQITWTDAKKVDLTPIYSKASFADIDLGLSISIKIIHVTDADNYLIFNHLRSDNISAALDMIEAHKGINAIDEWGQSALITAVQLNRIEVVASLLNTRMPRVNVNLAKSSGYTALFYAIELATPTILTALLRKGANPNLSVLQTNGQGNTPLHFACLFEKTKHAEILLEYGAYPDVKNIYGKVPLQLLPIDSLRSTKLYFKKMFETAMLKLAASAIGNSELNSMYDHNEL